LTSALVGDEWSASLPGRLTPGERDPGTLSIEGSVGFRADLKDVEKRKFLTLPELELRPLSRTARSQSLYRLRYLGSSGEVYIYIYNVCVLVMLSSATWIRVVVHLPVASADHVGGNLSSGCL
jgi:hypothetical protein